MQNTDHFRRASWALAAFVLLSCTVARGQIITSTILGHVTDSSGAVVPGAQVAVTNQGTSITSKTVTDSVGFYSVSGLVFGAYTVAVTQQGFETSQVTGVQLTSAQTQLVDVTLRVGTPRQVVTVTSEKVTMLHTDSITVGTTFTNQQLSELPLENDTIDAVDKIIPGFAFAQSLSNPRVNGGAYWGSNNYTLNGAENNDQVNGGQPYANGGYAIALPQPESLQEYRVDSINTNAEYARTTTITMVTRSGSNQFHGDLQELNANAALSANAFTNDGAIPKAAKPGYVRNQMGINIGGPIKRDRAFFFLNWSEYISRSYTPENLVQPSLVMDQGNFSALCTGTFNASGVCSNTGQQLYNPTNGQPFANNAIPTSMFAPQSATLLGYLPHPNVVTAGLPSGPTDFITQNRAADDIGVTNDRLDFKLTDKDLLYATYWRAGAPVYLQANAYPQTYGQDVYPPTNTGYTVAENHTFGPTALNEFRYSWFDREVVETGINLGFNPQTLFPGLQNSYNRGLPTMSLSGYTGMFHDVGIGAHSHNPAIEFTDNFSKVHGRHTFKFGADELGTKSYARANPGSLGSFTLNGQWSAGKGWNIPGVSGVTGVTQPVGNVFADFLLGDASSDTYTPPSTFGSNQYRRIWGFYGQDTFQATSRLTLYYGIRYEVQIPWWYQVNGGVGMSSYYNLGTNQLALPENAGTPFIPPIDASSVQYNAYNVATACAPNSSCFTTTQALGLPIKWMQTDATNFGPRFGFAYRPFHSDSTVIRAGYGVYYDQLNDPWSSMAGNTPFLGNAAAGLTFSSNLPKTPPAGGYQPDLTFADPFPGSGALAAATAHPTISYVPRNVVPAGVQQWNVTLEHEFRGQWLGQVTYFGDQAHHILWWASNVDIPTTMTAATLQSQLPEQPWAAIDSYRSGGKSNYEELQIQMSKRMTSGLMVQAYYTYAHSLDNVEGGSTTTEPADWHNPNADYGNTVFVRRQTFNIAYLYQLPFGQGKHFLAGSHGLVNALIGGWEWSGDTSYGSGMPFDITFAVPASDVGWFGQNTSPAVANRANIVSGQALYTGQDKSSHNIIAGVPWYNQSAFAAPAPYTWGNSARNQMFGPGWGDWDMALLKNFNIPGREGMKLQFRIEANNLFNHFNIGNPGSISSEFGSYVQIPAAGSTVSPTQGLITSCYPNCTFGGPYGQGNRYFQVGARLFF